METTPEALFSVSWNLWCRLNPLTVILSVSLSKVSCRHIARGLSRVNSSKLGLSPRHFHWISQMVEVWVLCLDFLVVFLFEDTRDNPYRLSNQPKFGTCCWSGDAVQPFPIGLKKHSFSWCPYLSQGDLYSTCSVDFFDPWILYCVHPLKRIQFFMRIPLLH